MSRRFSFSYFHCCYLFVLIVVSLFHLCPSSKNFDDNVLCLEREKQALLKFKRGLIDEAGRLASWDDSEERDCCKWVGVGCDNTTGHVDRVHLPGPDWHIDEDDSFYVNQLNKKEASKEMLRGNLGSSLLHLKQLRHLDLSRNDFGGIQVPIFIGSLRNLRYLNLSDSNFGGMIPPQLGNLSELQILSLGFNYGTNMMNMQWLTSLRMLRHLDMSFMDLSKAIDWFQVINSIPSLVQLHLSYTNLPEIHPHVASLNLTSLSLLDLSQNDFSTFFPQWIFGITSLVSLDLSWCRFQVPIPSNIYTFRNFTSIESVNVRGSNFMNSSFVLRELSTVGSNLVSLDISSCGISSSDLDSLHNLTSLLSLDLSRNQLTKILPISLGNFCNLIEIDLYNNNFSNISITTHLESILKCKSPALESLRLSSSKLSGTIPDSIGRLSFLRYLRLNGNLISGPIPFSIGRLSSLKMLDLSGNQLNGVLPYSIGHLSSLKYLRLLNNQLNGSLPNSLGQLSKLRELSFSYNLLTGVVTETHFSKLMSLKYLEGERNNLTLRLQLANWIPPFQLVSLDLNSWGLGPQFPIWLQSQKDLFSLDIRNTGISSPMPPESFWKSLPNLGYLDMSDNHIQGTVTLLSFPATLVILDLSSNELRGELTPISKFSALNYLDLSNNFFDGSLHNILCSNGVKHTEFLYLGNNNLSSVIPECWDKWPQLSFLNLENNNFSGGIPATLGFLSQLGSLNMRGNKLSGRVPASLMNLTNLLILQIGRNELDGNIPSWFGTGPSHLRLLNLRSNNFYGDIPLELCHLKNIHILDFSHNNLTGNIPGCFNNFSVLTGKI